MQRTALTADPTSVGAVSFVRRLRGREKFVLISPFNNLYLLLSS